MFFCIHLHQYLTKLEFIGDCMTQLYLFIYFFTKINAYHISCIHLSFYYKVFIS